MSDTPRLDACEDMDQVVNLTRTLERELAVLTAEIAAYRKTHRWNIREDEDGTLLICRGEHERSDDCSCHEIRYAPLSSS